MSLDLLKKIEALEAERTTLEQQLAAPGISEAKDHDIRQQIVAIDNQITALIGLLQSQQQQPAPAALLAAGAVPHQPIFYQRAELEGVGRQGQKQLVWSVASKHNVGGYVQRMARSKLVMLAVSTDAKVIANFYRELNVKCASSATLTLFDGGTAPAGDAQMRKVLGTGFKKISNRSLGSDASRELAPDDGASDIVDRAESLASIVWPYART